MNAQREGIWVKTDKDGVRFNEFGEIDNEGLKNAVEEVVQDRNHFKVAIIGYGWVGKAYHKMFPDAVIYDEPIDYYVYPDPALYQLQEPPKKLDRKLKIAGARDAVNHCDLALVCVPTDPKVGISVRNGEIVGVGLDMSIVEDVVSWLETPLILIKSALQPGTVDRLVAKTGKKIAVSVEMVGEGKYFVPYWKYPDAEDPTKHNFLIVGGEEETARRCADFLWAKMSPDINIHLTSAVEAEICKLMENTWGAMKVTFANTIYDICEDLGANYTRVLQAWGSDGRTEKMHMRVMPHKRGWKSKCYDKDIPALAGLDRSGFLKKMVEVNKGHLNANDDTK